MRCEGRRFLYHLAYVEPFDHCSQTLISLFVRGFTQHRIGRVHVSPEIDLLDLLLESLFAVIVFVVLDA